MTEQQQQFLNLLYNPGETICVTSGSYGAHSIEQHEIGERIPLQTPEKAFVISETDIQLVGINPINGYKRDSNVTAHRNFMIELDEGEAIEQVKYIKDSGIPYSACVFSGNKSVHFVIAVDQDYGENVWRFVNQWILNVLKMADQQNKTPSRGVRFPGNRRKNGKAMMQALIEIGGRVTQDDVNNWLAQHIDKKPVIAKPKIKEYDKLIGESELPISVIKKLQRLREGVQENRNESWFSVASFMALNGVSPETAEGICDKYFVESNDFKKSELLNCIRSAYKDR